MEAQVGKEERERDDENVVAIPELPRSVTKANERKMEKKFNQSQTQNNCESLLAPSSTHSRKKLYARIPDTTIFLGKILKKSQCLVKYPTILKYIPKVPRVPNIQKYTQANSENASYDQKKNFTFISFFVEK